LQYAGFVAMNPSNHARSHYDYFKDLIKGDGASTEAHRKFYDEYNAVLDMDANYYLQTIKVVFQDFSLVNGTWDVRNPQGVPERVRPQDIKTTALFSVEGELDDISGSGQTEAVHAICSGVVDSEQRHLLVPGAGHYGIFSGRRWREVVYPEVKKFILEHQPKADAVAPAKPAQATATKPAAPRKVAAKKPEPVAKVAAASSEVKLAATPVAASSEVPTQKATAPSKAKAPAKTARSASVKGAAKKGAAAKTPRVK
jgi:poly(3-hydroxybutyrate) depolymerase